MFRSSTRAGAAALTLWALLLAPAAAQQKEFVAAQQANRAALRHYTWTSRTELKVAGESKQVRLEQVRHDLDGQIQKTVVGGGVAAAEPGRPDPPGPAGGLRKRVVARKQAEFKDLLGDLASLAESYAHVPPERLKAFAARATIMRGEGLESGSVRIQGRDVLATGDRMTVWIDPASSMMRRVEIAAAYDGQPVSVVADYRGLDNGLTYQARSVLRYPAKGVEVTVESFDYRLSGAR